MPAFRAGFIRISGTSMMLDKHNGNLRLSCVMKEVLQTKEQARRIMDSAVRITHIDVWINQYQCGMFNHHSPFLGNRCRSCLTRRILCVFWESVKNIPKELNLNP